jgi:hypothetical protein
MSGMDVRAVPRDVYEPWLLLRHYAKRVPIVQHAFGLFIERECIGVVTFGSPSSPQVARSVISPGLSNLVMELNRLCVDDGAPKNASSMLVSASLRLLPRPAVIVSYADGSQGHVGYIYQATNFGYYGAAAAHDAEYESPLGEIVHPRSMVARGITNPTAWARENGWSKRQAMPKHRYVYLCGSPRQKRNLAKELLWEQQPYPKGETQRYNAKAYINSQPVMF